MSNKLYIQRCKGVYHNTVTGRVVMPDVLKEHGYPVTDKHRSAYDAETAKFIDDYRKAQANMSEDAKAERASELRAVHGPCVEITNAITGERFTT